MIPQRQTLTVVVSGLAGMSMVTLQDGSRFMSAGNGSHPWIHVGNGYNVVIARQPPGQTCTVVDGVSNAADPAPNPIKVNCSGAYGIGGTVSGLAPGERVSLSESGARDLLRVDSNGPFRFTRLVMRGYQYQVEADAPETKKCSVAHESGTVRDADITDILIQCTVDQDLDGVTVGVEDADLMEVPPSEGERQAEDDTEGGCQPQTFRKRVVLKPGVEGWFLTETCGGSGGQSFSLVIGGKPVLGEFGSGVVILRTQTKGMPDLTVLHGGPGAEPERYRFDGNVYKSVDNPETGAATPARK
jgi:hypothetical protein